ncbi:hypothetical protein SNEBB_001899 [Seison nebaliae]|nr:hypothetical protein SNEBB_001899 [Seison nebaliae]
MSTSSINGTELKNHDDEQHDDNNIKNNNQQTKECLPKKEPDLEKKTGEIPTDKSNLTESNARSFVNKFFIDVRNNNIDNEPFEIVQSALKEEFRNKLEESHLRMKEQLNISLGKIGNLVTEMREKNESYIKIIEKAKSDSTDRFPETDL